MNTVRNNCVHLFREYRHGDLPCDRLEFYPVTNGCHCHSISNQPNWSKFRLFVAQTSVDHGEIRASNSLQNTPRSASPGGNGFSMETVINVLGSYVLGVDNQKPGKKRKHERLLISKINSPVHLYDWDISFRQEVKEGT